MVLEILNYMGFHLWPTLYFYWIAVALRFNNSFSLVETVYWKEKKTILSWCMGFTGVWVVFVSVSFLSDHQFRRVCVPIRFSTQKALWRSYIGKSSRKSCFTIKVGRVIFQNCINVLIFRLSKLNTVIMVFLNFYIFENLEMAQTRKVWMLMAHEIVYYHLLYLMCNSYYCRRENYLKFLNT